MIAWDELEGGKSFHWLWMSVYKRWLSPTSDLPSVTTRPHSFLFILLATVTLHIRIHDVCVEDLVVLTVSHSLQSIDYSSIALAVRTLGSIKTILRIHVHST
jgi:hypothetical protein